ncbi:MAG: polysaccharide deacetylase family protein [Bacteroidota bacterium]
MKMTCFLLLFLSITTFGQKWNGYKSAVVLTYDDALNVHLDNVVPALDSAGFKGTFYLTVSSAAFTNRMDEWKITAIKGHELGNHTMYHPCAGGKGREWVRPDYDLNTYSIKRIEDEIRMTNIMLQSVDGKSERSFAYPCADTKANGQSYIEAITDDFVGARGVRDEIIPFGKAGEIDIYNTACFSMVNASGESMIELVKKGMKEGGLVIFLFHGVGGEHNLNVDLKEHRKLIHFLKENQEDIWVAPFIDVAKFLKALQH